MSGQLTLLPSEAPELRRENLPLEAIDGFSDAVPSAKLRELICDLGLLQPIVVVPSRSGRFRVVEGRRRCKAIAQLAEAGEWPTPPHVDTLVVEASLAGRREVRGGLTLALHASRSPSPASELRAIEAILAADDSSDQAATIKEIAAQTGITPQTVRRRLRLRSLSAGLRDAFDHGVLAASVAEAAARLPADMQGELERGLRDRGRLTLAEVRERARGQATTATGELPEDLFADRELPWQASVRSHLASALAAIPTDQPLKRTIIEALAVAQGL